MHSQFLRETEGMQDQTRWQWLKADELKQELKAIYVLPKNKHFEQMQ